MKIYAFFPLLFCVALTGCEDGKVDASAAEKKLEQVGDEVAAKVEQAKQTVEQTVEQAKHFKLGPKMYEGCINPWNEPIGSPYLERVQKGLPPFEVNGGWPWNEDFFPKPSS